MLIYELIPYIMGLQYQLFDKVENPNKITNAKGAESMESYVAPLLTA